MTELRYSGGLLNKFARSSIGGVMSDTVIVNNSLENLFDNVTRVEVINGRTEFRLFYIFNEGGTKFFNVALRNIIIPEDTELAFAIDDSDSPQALSTEDEVPVGLSFWNFDEWDNLVVPIGKYDVGDRIPVWMRRKVLQGSNIVRKIGLSIKGDPDMLVISQDFGTVENIFDNCLIKPRSSSFLTDVDLVGESLTS